MHLAAEVDEVGVWVVDGEHHTVTGEDGREGGEDGKDDEDGHEDGEDDEDGEDGADAGPNKKESESDRAAVRFGPNPAVPPPLRTPCRISLCTPPLL